MTRITHLLSRPDTLVDISLLLSKIARAFLKTVGSLTNWLKFLFVDVSFVLTKLPFGNWVSIVYILALAIVLKSALEDGEISRVLFRSFRLYFVDQLSGSECFDRLKQYLWRGAMIRLESAESWLLDSASTVWEYTGVSVKRKVVSFAKEVVLENADEIERRAIELTKTAVFAAMVHTAAQEFSSEITALFVQTMKNTNANAETEKTTPILDNIGVVKRAVDQNTAVLQFVSAEISVLHNAIMDADALSVAQNVALNQKIDDMSARLEYLRSSHPDLFVQLMNSVIMPSALSDSPITVMNAIAKLTGMFSARRALKS